MNSNISNGNNMQLPKYDVNTGQPIIYGNNNNFQNGVNQNKKSSGKTIVIVIIVCVVLFISAFVGIFLLIFYSINTISNNSNKLVCESDSGSVTILYNDEQLTGYSAVFYDFDFDYEKRVAARIGVDEYLSEFKTSFESKTGGTCTYRGKDENSKTETI